MPGTKYVRKNKYTRYKKRKRKKENAGQKALRLVYRIKDQVNVENKYARVFAVGTRPDWSGAITSLNNGITQGIADINNRVGDSIKCQTLMFNYALEQQAGAAFTRIVIFWDKENSITVASDLFAQTGTTNYPVGHKTYDKRFNSIVLYDELISSSVNSSKEMQVKKLIISINKHTQFNSAGVTINTGALKLFRSSNWDPINVNRPYLTYESRLLYTDN